MYIVKLIKLYNLKYVFLFHVNNTMQLLLKDSA